MNDWVTAGLPCVAAERFSVVRDAGLLSTSNISPWRRQTVGFKAPRRDFRVSVYMLREELDLMSDFLDTNTWFTIGLVSDGCLRDHTVRLSRQYTLEPFGAGFMVSLSLEEQITADAPDMTAYPISVDNKDCCLPDEFNCCGGSSCISVVFYDRRGGGNPDSRYDWVKTDGSPLAGVTNDTIIFMAAVEFRDPEASYWAPIYDLIWDVSDPSAVLNNPGSITEVWAEVDNLWPRTSSLVGAGGLAQVYPYYYDDSDQPIAGVAWYEIVKENVNEPASITVYVKTNNCDCESDEEQIYSGTYRID